MCRLKTKELKEALNGFPLYSQDGKGKEAICRAVFSIGSARWYILEGNDEGEDVTMFGIVIGLLEDEYGYVSLKEMSEIEVDFTSRGAGIRRVNMWKDFKPTALKNIPDPKLRKFLARFEN